MVDRAVVSTADLLLFDGEVFRDQVLPLREVPGPLVPGI
jgi:hypothetical protein